MGGIMNKKVVTCILGSRGFGKSHYIEEQKEHFYEQNIGLLKVIARRYNYSWEDLSLAFVQAVETYNPKMGSWSTYLWKCCHNQIFYERRKKRIDCVDLNEDTTSSNGLKIDEKLLINSVKTAYKRLDAKEKEIIYHYLQGIPQTEIAVAMGYSQSQISRLLEQTINKIKKAVL